MSLMTVHYEKDQAWIESVSLSDLARRVETPVYLYSARAVKTRAKEWLAAFSHYPSLSCFAVKSNAHPQVLATLSALGFGADVVSGGELELALAAGFAPEKIVFSGVGKTTAELTRALTAGIYCLNVESGEELEEIAVLAAASGKKAPIALRINPDIDPHTHPHIATGMADTKFGIEPAVAKALSKKFATHPSLEWKGLACHLGSQIMELDPFREAARQMVSLAEEMKLQGIQLQHLDLGGGLGIGYDGEPPPALKEYAEALLESVRPTGLRLLLEPGRALVAHAGVLLTQVIRTKQTSAKTFVIVDAGMNDCLRPALYEAFHRISAVKQAKDEIVADVVGPICETADTLGFARKLPKLQTGDLLLIHDAGAYGATMASTYNERARAKEGWIDGSQCKI